jgi:hypothetical protein
MTSQGPWQVLQVRGNFIFVTLPAYVKKRYKNHIFPKKKVEVKLSLYLAKHRVMKMYWRSVGIAPRILDLGTRWRWVVSFTPRERAPGIHWLGGWVGSRAVLDAVVKWKFSSPHRESNPRTPIVQPIARRCKNNWERWIPEAEVIVIKK